MLMADASTVMTGATALLVALGGGGLLQRWYDRRIERQKEGRAEDKAERAESSTASQATLKLLLESMQKQLDGYEERLKSMQAKSDSLERKIHDLEVTNRRYEAGQLVAPGYALVPVPHIAYARKAHPGALMAEEYPGENPGATVIVPIKLEDRDGR